MSKICRIRFATPAIVTVLVIALSAPIAVHAEEQIMAAAPDAGQAWDEASGYASLEASRAATTSLAGPEGDASWDVTSGYGAVEAVRVNR